MSDTTPNDAKFTGKHMIFAMLGFFAVILCANLTMVYFAKKSWTGLVTEHSYKDNQVFDKKTEQLNKMHQLGVSLSARYEDQKIIITAHDLNKEVIKGAVVDLVVGRVIHEQDDQMLRLTETGAGEYQANYPLAPGRWQLKVSMTWGEDKTWQKTYHIQVKDK